MPLTHLTRLSGTPKSGVTKRDEVMSFSFSPTESGASTVIAVTHPWPQTPL